MHDEGQLLADFIHDAETLTVLTGAGVSTASGIPDYRDRDGNWKHARPVQFADFVQSALVRARYWSRSFSGWARINSATPNPAHAALAALEHSGRCHWLITQNVDGLHASAGSQRVTDLHGRLDSVRCLSCDCRGTRSDWQNNLADANPDWQGRVTTLKPDGDAEITEVDGKMFNVPDCAICGGIIKPDVVFFGESVPSERVDTCVAALENTGGLLVAGSSLMVFSGFRFARLAVEIGKPIAIVNQGRTRADDMAQLKITGDCGRTLTNTVRLLGSESRPGSGLQ